MKMRKILYIFSMIAIFCTLTACSSGQEEVDFNYTNADIIYSAMNYTYQLQNADPYYRAYLEDTDEEGAAPLLQGINNFDNAIDECGAFVGYRAEGSGKAIMIDIANLDTTNPEDVVVLKEFVSSVDSNVTENGNTVVVELTAVHEKREVVYTYVFKKNPAFDYAYELYGQALAPYMIQEITAAPNYSVGEKMAKAGSNTLMGMGTVFVVLIFISIVIAQFERINKLSVKISNWWTNRKNKKKDEESTADTGDKALASVPVASAGSAPALTDDSQLIAVITAAVVAANVAAGGTDKLIVRSIKKARR